MTLNFLCRLEIYATFWWKIKRISPTACKFRWMGRKSVCKHFWPQGVVIPWTGLKIFNFHRCGAVPATSLLVRLLVCFGGFSAAWELKSFLIEIYSEWHVKWERRKPQNDKLLECYNRDPFSVRQFRYLAGIFRIPIFWFSFTEL